jgi:hypothetical protein
MLFIAISSFSLKAMDSKELSTIEKQILFRELRNNSFYFVIKNSPLPIEIELCFHKDEMLIDPAKSLSAKESVDLTKAIFNKIEKNKNLGPATRYSWLNLERVKIKSKFYDRELLCELLEEYKNNN